MRELGTLGSQEQRYWERQILTGGVVHRMTTEQEKIYLRKDTETVGRIEGGHRMRMVEPKAGLMQGTIMVGQTEGSVHKRTMEGERMGSIKDIHMVGQAGVRRVTME
jgi:hypothetical protein